MATPTPPVMKLTTDLGEVLRLRSLSATEEMGRLFEFSVLALAQADDDIDSAALLGTSATVSLELGHDGTRHFNGMVVRAGLEAAVGKLVSWRLQLRPWLWQLTRRSDSRIYQNMTVENIIKDVFTTYAGPVEWQLTGTFAPRPYCVQYRETDFNFVSRLMEEEGMYYFHRHAADSHTLVICNAMTTHQSVPGFDTVKYRDSQDQLVNLEAITEWRHTHELTSGKVTLTDYDYLKPATGLKVEHTSAHDTAKAELEHYDFPGLYTDAARGGDLARVRQQELDARVLRTSGFTTTACALSVGHSFVLADHPLDSENVNHVVLSTRIDAQYAGYESGQGPTSFTCRFTAMRYAHVFRPERITPKPIIPGPQTAVVVGPSGEEIHTDQYGRAKVKFHWDRLNTSDQHEKTSCWVRVSSQWAGKGWGQISLPRIGQEVVVDFLEGDPDLPLITGRVYNAVQVVPYKLPDNKTVSTLKSQSSVGGSIANANELRFEDKKGDEYIWFQAEKDMRHLVKNDSNTWIKRHETRLIGADFTEHVIGKHHMTVDDEQNILIKKKHQTEIQEDSTYYVGGAFKLSAGATSVKADSTGVAVSSLDLAAQQGVKIKAMSVDIKADTAISMEAGTMISMKVGGNFVCINPAGVMINGTMVMINSGGSAGPVMAAQPSSPSKGSEPLKPEELKDKLA